MNRNNSLPPLNYYPNLPESNPNNTINYGNPSQRSQSALMNYNEIQNFNNSATFSIENNNNNYIISEIKNIKQLIKNQFQNQNELQNKIIDYNRIISQQENIIRMNSSKINDQDTKLTNILMSFNNYLKFQEKTTGIINDCQNKIENSLLPINVFNEFQNNILSNNENVNDKIATLFNLHDKNNTFINGVKQESGNFQEFTLGKIKFIEDKLDNAISEIKTENLNFIKKQTENLNQKINQVKKLTELVENNLNEEVKNRKLQNEKFYNDIYKLLAIYDEKFKKVEKDGLETEKNLIAMIKDYVKTLKDLMNKNQENNNTEFKSIRSIIEGGFIKVENEANKEYASIKENFSLLKSDINENRTIIDELESYLKDSIKSLNDNLNKNIDDVKAINDKVNNINNDFDKFNNNNEIMIDNKIKSIIDKYDSQFIMQRNELENKFQNQIEINSKDIIDLFEKNSIINDLISKLSNSENPEINNLLKNLNNNNNNDNTGSLNNRLEIVSNKIKNECEEDFKKMKDMVNKNMENLANVINDSLDKKIGVLSSDVKDQYNKYQNLIDGRVQKYILESEKRISEKYENDIVKIQSDLEELFTKYGNLKI